MQLGIKDLYWCKQILPYSYHTGLKGYQGKFHERVIHILFLSIVSCTRDEGKFNDKGGLTIPMQLNFKSGNHKGKLPGCDSKEKKSKRILFLHLFSGCHSSIDLLHNGGGRHN